jgi:hypothetical protein
MTNKLTHEEVATLAEFLGWAILDNGERYYFHGPINDKEAKLILTDPRTLIEVRLKIINIFIDLTFEKSDLCWTDAYILSDHILNAQYTEAAKKAAEIILKLKQ